MASILAIRYFEGVKNYGGSGRFLKHDKNFDWGILEAQKVSFHYNFWGQGMNWFFKLNFSF